MDVSGREKSTLKQVTNKYVLGQILSDELPAIAVNALEQGYDSSALRQLATTEIDDAERNRLLFFRAMEELGTPMPSPAEAALDMAKAIAAEVLTSKLPPYRGAKEIWGKVYARFPELSQLRVFVGLASEYEDDPEHRPMYDQTIVEECASLLNPD